MRLAVINPHTKFKVSTFTHFEGMKGNSKCNKKLYRYREAARRAIDLAPFPRYYRLFPKM